MASIQRDSSSTDLNESFESLNNDRFEVQTISAKASTDTCVVHLGFIPQGTPDIEIIAVAAPFGRVIHYINIKSKNQALLEFSNPSESSDMVEYFRVNPLLIRHTKVSVRFSNHKSVEPRNSNKDLQSMYESFRLLNKSRVLHSSIRHENRFNQNDFEKIFSPFGEVKKIVAFDKKGYNQCLIEMKNIESAIIAKISLDGCCVLNCNDPLKVEFAKVDRLQNTAPIPPRTHELPSLPRHIPTYDHHDDNSPHLYLRDRRYPNRFPSPKSNDRFSNFRDNYYDNHPPFSRPRQRSRSPIMKRNSIIIIGNLPSNISCDDLFNFVGCYGDIKCIKFLYKKPGTALVEMGDSVMAETAINYLNRIDFGGSLLQIGFSNISHVSLNSSSENQHLTKDFSNHHLNRFRKPGSRNYRHIYPPSRRLHVSNFSSDMTANNLKDLFDRVANIRVEKVDFLPNTSSQAIVETYSLTDAIYGIMRLHNFRLASKNELKVTFAKS